VHVAVFADIEGSFGIWRMRQCRTGTREWQYGRECLTEDVNCAIGGAFDAGADKVTVKDTHETGFNCLPQRLDPRAGYVGYDLVLYVAIHAASGTPDAFFAHTHYGIFAEVCINGRRVCETEIYGGYMGELGMPIGLVSGDEIAVEQALEVVPWARSVVVDKRKETYTSGEKSAAYLRAGRAELRKTAAAAVAEASSMKPLILEGPLHFEAVFRSEELARKYNSWDFPRVGATVKWEAGNMTEGFEKLNQLTFLARRIYPFRRPFFFAMRNYSRVKSRYFAPRPNREGAPAPSARDN
jgi:D-amino peptidase